MKKKILLVIIAMMLCTACFGIIACGKKPLLLPLRVTDGRENGEYYNDAAGVEYVLTLNSGNYSFAIGTDTETGTYTLADGAFSFGSKSKITSGTYADGTVTLVYNGSSIKLIKKVEYTVTFNSNGGSAVDALKVINGKAAQRPDDPTKAGSIFVGWYTDSNFSARYLFTDAVTANITLYARWVSASDEIYKIEFVTGKSGITVPDAHTIEGKLEEIPTLSYSGQTFKGWYVSAYDEADKPTYRVTENTVFTEDTTLYAQWENTLPAGKLATPAVTVDNNITWNAVTGARNYVVEITGPEGFPATTVEIPSFGVGFNELPAGDYVIKVTAKAPTSTNDSDTAVVYYKNKALPKVTRLQVEQNVLQYKGAEGAEKYLIIIDCGDKSHKHSEEEPIDNGTNTTYDFGSCKMQAGGIKFTVVAQAAGKASSKSKTLTHCKDLDAVDENGITVDEQQNVKWAAVENAERYTLNITCENAEHDHTTGIDVGSATSYSLKTCSGNIEVVITPVADGYNSPEGTKHIYSKKYLATPDNIRIIGNTLHWAEVAGASGYEVRVEGGEVASAQTNEFDLTRIISGANGTEFKLQVRATGGLNSAWSDYVDAVYHDISKNIEYSANTLTWQHVIGASKYEISVNGVVQTEVDDGRNYAAVTLTKAGENEIKLRYSDGAAYGSAQATVKVVAYSITFHSGLGSEVETVFVANGDALDLPESTRAGYKFGGWYLSDGESGNGELYDASVFTGTADKELYAYWESVKYTLNYDYSNGTGKDLFAQVDYGKHYTLEVPTSNDPSMAFVGWYSLSNGGTAFTDANGNSLDTWNVQSGATLYAHYLPVFEFIAQPNGTYAIVKGEYIDRLATVTIPARYNGAIVSVIDRSAFEGCSQIVKVRVPDTVSIIDSDTAFDGCTSLVEFEVYHVEGNNNIVYSSGNGSLVYYNSRTHKYELNCIPPALTGEYTVPSTVNTLVLNTFNNVSFSVINVPSTVTSVEVGAFINCSALTEINFRYSGSTPLTVADGAFDNLPNLVTVNLPARLKDFKAADFIDCPSLNAVNIENGGNYTSEDGIICSNDGTVIFCPMGKAGVVTMPTGVRTVGEKAFKDCVNVTEIVIPTYITSIADNAFENCTGLVKVTFKGGATARDLTIGNYVFSGCEKLENIVFESGSKVVSIGDYAFSGCGKISEMQFPATVKTVGAYAFNGCKGLTGIGFASGDTEIEFGDYAFNGCDKLTTIHLTANVQNFSPTVFDGCTGITQITVDAANKFFSSEGGLLFNKNKTEIKYVPTLFEGENGVYTIPQTVTNIGAATFKGRNGITKVVIGSQVTEIGFEAFRACKNLETLVFEAGSGSELAIGDYAFAECTALLNFEFPTRSKLTIGGYAFAACYKISGTLTIPEGVTTIGEFAFSSLSSFNLMETKYDKIVLPESLTDIGDYAFARSAATQIEFGGNAGSSPLTIGVSAFQQSSKLTGTLTLPANLTVIGDDAFYSCSSIEKVFIPKSVTSIGGAAFRTCNKLAEVEFEAGGTHDLVMEDHVLYETLKPGTFSDDTALKFVNLPERLTRIAAFAFSGCTNLVTNNRSDTVNNFIIPATVSFIGQGAFRKCSALVTVTFAENENSPSSLTIEEGAIYGNNGADTYGVFAMNETNSFSTYSAPKLKTVVLPSRLTVIPRYAFFCCTALENVTIKNTVTKIGVGAFYNCYNLVSNEENNIFEAGNDGVALTIEDSNFTVNAGGNVPAVSDLYAPGAFAVYYNTASASYNAENRFTFVTLPNRLVRVPDFAFYNRGALVGVSMSNNIANTTTALGIGRYAFAGCAKLNTVTFTGDGNNILCIDTGAFMNCAALENIQLPDARMQASVIGGKEYDAIGSNAFAGCNKLDMSAYATGLVLNGSKTEVVRCGKDYDGAIVIPATVKTIRANAFDGCAYITSITFEEGSVLTTIGDYAFRDCGGINSSFELPASVKTIGNYAFAGVSVGKLPVGDNTSLTTIGEHAFDGSDIATLTVPSSVTYIGNYAFYDCADLTGITFADSGALTIGNYAFAVSSAQKGNKLGTVNFTASVSAVGDYVFNGRTGITSVTFADGCVLTGAGKGVFAGTNITSFEVPEKLVYIDNTFFEGMKLLEEITADENNRAFAARDGALYDKLYTSLVAYPYGKKGEYVVPSSVTSIAAYTFNGYVNLTAITLPSKLTEIPAGLFMNCTALTSVTIPDTVTSVGTDAFKGCNKLSSITIPASVRSIADGAFGDCTALANVTFAAPTGTQTAVGLVIEANAFKGCNNSGFTAIELPARLSYLGTSAFGNCTNLASVTFKAAVAGESNLPQLTVGTKAFGGCNKLAEIVFEENNTLAVLSDSAFESLSGLKSVVLSSGLERVGESAFESCSSLERVEFKGNNVTAIGERAFWQCSKLNYINLPTSITSIEKNTFYGCSSLKSIVIPYGVTSIGDSAFWASGLTVIDIPSSVVSIGDTVFFQASKLEYMCLPNSVETIGIQFVLFASDKLTIYVEFEQDEVPSKWGTEAYPFNQVEPSVTTTKYATVHYGSTLTAHTATFVTDWEDAEAIDSVTAKFLLELPVPVNGDTVFEGWYTDADFSGDKISAPYALENNVTLYAKWKSADEPPAPVKPDGKSFASAYELNIGTAFTYSFADFDDKTVYFKFTATKSSVSVNSTHLTGHNILLYSAPDSLVETKNMSGNGSFTFSGLTAGETYYLKVVNPNGIEFVTPSITVS